MEKERDSSIELLRILGAIGVIILYLNNEWIGGGFKYVIYGTTNFYLLKALETIFICVVNVFIIIFASFLVKTNTRKLSKLQK